MARPPEPERRENTLARATDYVLAHGLSGLSLRPLAAALAISTRMLLYDFGSKENLIAAILAEARRRETALLAEHAPSTDSASELLHGMWAWISAPERRPFLRLFFEIYLDAATHPQAYAEHGRTMVTDWLDSIGRAFTPSTTDQGDPAVTTLIIAVIRGLLLDLLATNDQHRTDQALTRFANLIEPQRHPSPVSPAPPAT
jgi:AcrR family transcriptional regulator